MAPSAPSTMIISGAWRTRERNISWLVHGIAWVSSISLGAVWGCAVRFAALFFGEVLSRLVSASVHLILDNGILNSYLWQSYACGVGALPTSGNRRPLHPARERDRLAEEDQSVDVADFLQQPRHDLIPTAILRR